MATIVQRLQQQDWQQATNSLHEQGYAQLPGILSAAECRGLIDDYTADNNYRKAIQMERYRFGSGQYKYYRYPLPSLIADIRQSVYPYLAPVANRWMEQLNIDIRFPASHAELLQRCHQRGQTKPTALILQYGKGGFNTLHQDLYGEVYFPMQLVLTLNQEEEDYMGGEFVLTEQIPRAQSKANVLRPQRGDMLLFTTNFRPVKGTKGYYRVNMKHGVSPLHSGVRHTLGIIFHDGLA